MADPCPLCSPINRMVPRFSPTRDPIRRPVRTRGQKDAVSKVKFHLPPANDCIDLVDRGSCRPSSSSRSTCDKLRGWHRDLVSSTAADGAASRCALSVSCWCCFYRLYLAFTLLRGGSSRRSPTSEKENAQKTTLQFSSLFCFLAVLNLVSNLCQNVKTQGDS